jgi:hypothetical protein
MNPSKPTPTSASAPPVASSRQPARWCLLGLLLPLGACTSFQPPQPWEKAELARPVMRMDRDPLEAGFSSHVYFSREASSGGDGVGGGGCGCN